MNTPLTITIQGADKYERSDLGDSIVDRLTSLRDMSKFEIVYTQQEQQVIITVTQIESQ